MIINFRRVSTTSKPQNISASASPRMNKKLISVILFGVAALGGGGAWFAYQQKNDPYPPLVRQRLKYALYLKHLHLQQNTKYDKPLENPVISQYKSTKPSIKDVHEAFIAAIQEAKSAFNSDMQSPILTGIIVEAADFCATPQSGRNDGFDSIKLYSEAIRLVLNLKPGTALPRTLHLSRGVDEMNYSGEQLVRAASVGYKMAQSYQNRKDLESAETVLEWCIETLMASCLLSSADLGKDSAQFGSQSMMEKFKPVKKELGACMEALADLYKQQRRYEEASAVYQGILKVIDTDSAIKSSSPWMILNSGDVCRKGHILNSMAVV